MSTMFPALCRMSRTFVIHNNNSVKITLRNTIRYNTTVANVLKSYKVKPKKEPGEVFKWILLVCLYTHEEPCYTTCYKILTLKI